MEALKIHAKFAGASAVATGTDAAVFALLTHLQPPSVGWSAFAALLAAAVGAVVHFLSCRHYVFVGRSSPVGESAVRYLGVSATTAALHSASVAALVAFGTSAAVAWAVAKVLVYFGWSFPAARHLVFERS